MVSSDAQTEVGFHDYGLEPGLRFAVRLDGKGGGTPLNWRGVVEPQPPEGLLWIHLEREDAATMSWIRGGAGLDPMIAEALLAQDSRPRVEALDDGLLVILRGICAGKPGQPPGPPDDVDLVPLHIWVDANRLITVRDQGHYLTALRDIHESLAHGKGPSRPGELLARITGKIVRDLEVVLDTLDDDIDNLEDGILELKDKDASKRLSQTRRRAVYLRRYLAPQRDALNSLQHERPSWFIKADARRVRDTADKVQHYIEYLDSTRDRATILHEDLRAVLGAQVAQNSNRLAAVAGLFLPPSLIAGIFGMNVGGIPGNTQEEAFIVLGVMMVVMMTVTLFILRRLRWI